MKRILITLALLAVGLCPALAQSNLNTEADNIVGNYTGVQNGDQYKVRVSKQNDGTYKGQIFWMAQDCDKNGKKLLDEKNPDKSLRNTPCDQIVLFSGLQYNAKKHLWDGTKIYDPQRGIKAKMTAEFLSDGRLKLRGTVLGIGESIYWQKIK